MTPNPCQQAFFDERAERWDDIVTHKEEKIKHILQFLNVKGGDRILDVGTGTGILVPYLAERIGPSGQLLAVDFSKNMIEVAQRKFPADQYPHVKFIAEDIMQFAPEELFDAIVCFSCFPHFIEQKKAIAHMARLLKDSGRLLIAHEDSRDYINNLHKDAGEEVEEDYLPPIEVLMGYMHEVALHTPICIDNEQYYILCGVKKTEKGGKPPAI